jgi:tetratricopeptide (TPR) repeat protein
MSIPWRAAIRLIAIAFSIACATPANAQPDDSQQRVEARRHYEAGLAHFNLREYKQAVDEFQAAYRLRPDPVFLYNLGQSYRLANDPEQALYFYRAYLRTSQDPPNRQEVEDRIAVLEKLMADKQKLATPPDHALSPDAKPQVVEKAPETAAAPVAATATPTSDRGHTPVYKKWWLWTVVGVVVVGAAVGIGVGVASQKSATFNASAGTVGPAALSVVRW